MNNIFNEIRRAVSQADHAQRAVDESTNDMARLIQKRLQHVNIHILRNLKHELKNFNAVTGEWKL